MSSPDPTIDAVAAEVLAGDISLVAVTPETAVGAVLAALDRLGCVIMTPEDRAVLDAAEAEADAYERHVAGGFHHRGKLEALHAAVRARRVAAGGTRRMVCPNGHVSEWTEAQLRQLLIEPLCPIQVDGHVCGGRPLRAAGGTVPTDPTYSDITSPDGTVVGISVTVPEGWLDEPTDHQETP